MPATSQRGRTEEGLDVPFPEPGAFDSRLRSGIGGLSGWSLFPGDTECAN